MNDEQQAAESTPAAEAGRLAGRGFAVFPADHPALPQCSGIGKWHDPTTCEQRGKHPSVKFTTEHTTDPEEIRRQLTRRPQNYGIYVGACRGPADARLFVMDSDRPGAIEDVAKARGEAWLTTMRVLTAKGYHDYLWGPADLELGNGLGALKGEFDGDVRAGNAYVIGPGSVHQTGAIYTLENPEQPPVHAPAWLLDALTARPKAASVPIAGITVSLDRLDAYTRKVVQDECDAITYASDGDQNNTINTSAFNLGTLVGAGALSEGEARQHLLAAARAGNHPEGRAVGAIASGLGAGMAQPRHPWPPVSRETAGVTPGPRDHQDADGSPRKPEPNQGLATLSESPNMRLPETFWGKSTQLTAIREAARRRHNSPEMLMVIVLTRIAALCGPTVRVATGAGDPATLSVFGAGVGESGSGKGRGDKTGRKLLPFDYKTLGEDFVSIGISTGRGITAAFLAKKEVQLGHPDFDEEADAKGKPQEKRLTQVATRAYATEDEGSTMMAAIQSKHGADIPGTLCKCWIGEEHRQSNATEELRRSLDADSYTMSMFATFQPDPAAELLATGSIGLPQRTLFTLAYRSEEEIEATRDRTETTAADWDDYGDDRQQTFVHVAELIAPGTNGMTVAKFAEDLHDVVVRLPVAAQREIARMIADGESRETTVHPLDKHRPLQLAKAAAVFALLHGETAVRRLHWDMANDLWAMSVAVRSMIEALAETKVRQAAEARRADAVATSRAVKAAEIEVETGANPVVVRLARKLARKLQAKGPMRSSDAQRGLIAGSDRRAYQETGADAPLWPAVAGYAVDSGIVSVDGDGVFSVA